jgi:hypothetical protein
LGLVLVLKLVEDRKFPDALEDLILQELGSGSLLKEQDAKIVLGD